MPPEINIPSQEQQRPAEKPQNKVVLSRQRGEKPPSKLRSRLLAIQMISALAVMGAPDTSSATTLRLMDSNAACVAGKIEEQLVKQFPDGGTQIIIAKREGSGKIDIVAQTKEPDKDGLSADVVASDSGYTTIIRYPLNKDIDGDGHNDDAVVSQSRIGFMRDSSSTPASEFGSPNWSKAVRKVSELHNLTDVDALIVDCDIDSEKVTK